MLKSPSQNLVIPPQTFHHQLSVFRAMIMLAKFFGHRCTHKVQMCLNVFTKNVFKMHLQNTKWQNAQNVFTK